MLCKCFFGCPGRSKNKAWKSNEKNKILSTSLQRKGWRQDLQHLRTVLQHFVLVKHTAHRLTEKEQRPETGENSDPFNPPPPEIWDEQNVISSLLLPWLIVWLHLIVNNCWQNLGKPRSGPPLPPSVPVTSHHREITGGLRAWRAHTFLISYLSLLGVILWGNRADLSASTGLISTPGSHLI